MVSSLHAKNRLLWLWARVVIPLEPGRVFMKLWAFSFSKDALKVLRTMVLDAGKISRFSFEMELSRKREFLISP